MQRKNPQNRRTQEGISIRYVCDVCWKSWCRCVRRRFRRPARTTNPPQWIIPILSNRNYILWHRVRESTYARCVHERSALCQLDQVLFMAQLDLDLIYICATCALTSFREARAKR